MRIPSVYISSPPDRLQTPAGKTVSQVDQRRTTPADDSYQKNRQQDIIDAEYVEFHSPSIQTLQQERQTLDNTLDPDPSATKQMAQTGQAANSPMGKYQNFPSNNPPSGSLINILA